jgi:hypothetical protein|nr:MAG TPA: Protein of unknown function DUF262 [Caudoviricetes sp.]
MKKQIKKDEPKLVYVGLLDLNKANISHNYIAKSEDGFSYIVERNGEPKLEFFYDIIKSGDRAFQVSATSRLPKNVYNTQLDALMLRMRNTNMTPVYQRGLVWNIADKRKLIDALVNDRSIGAITYARNSFSDKYLYEILDGKQRLSTIAEFIADGFTYQDILFSELSKKEQDAFLNKSIGVIEVTFNNDREKIEYFIELNSAGVRVSDEFLTSLKTEYRIRTTK